MAKSKKKAAEVETQAASADQSALQTVENAAENAAATVVASVEQAATVVVTAVEEAVSTVEEDFNKYHMV